jgi:hypothetical protein
MAPPVPDPDPELKQLLQEVREVQDHISDLSRRIHERRRAYEEHAARITELFGKLPDEPGH